MSDLTVLMAAVIIGGLFALGTVASSVGQLTNAIFSQSGTPSTDFHAKFVKAR